jgi:hypothetical protein
MRDIAIPKSFQDWEIEGDTDPHMPSRIAVAWVPRKVSTGFRVMFTMVGSGWWLVGRRLPVISCQLSVASCQLPRVSGEWLADRWQLPVGGGDYSAKATSSVRTGMMPEIRSCDAQKEASSIGASGTAMSCFVDLVILCSRSVGAGQDLP